MGKSPDAFRTISEVAEWLETPAHVLRFWESRFSQVKPVKRAGGRRYYRPADMLLLGGIKKLLHEDGVTIKGVQKILRKEGIKHVSALSEPLKTSLESGAPVSATATEKPALPTDNVIALKTQTAPASKAPEAVAAPPADTAEAADAAMVKHHRPDQPSLFDDYPAETESKPAATEPRQSPEPDPTAPRPGIKPGADPALPRIDTLTADPVIQEVAGQPPAAPIAEPAKTTSKTVPDASADLQPGPRIPRLDIPDDPTDSAEYDVGPTIAARLRRTDRAALAANSTAIAAIYSRLRALRDRMAG